MTENSTVELPAKMAYWLVPAEPFLSSFQKSISDFAVMYNGSDFIPHATIYFGEFDSRDEVDTIMDKLSFFKELRLHVDSLLFTEQFTQSCFIKFKNLPALTEMCEMVRSQLHKPESYQVVPHMSLFYGHLDSKAREEITKSMALPKAISFNLICAIANPAQVASREDVEYWYEKARRVLGKT